jgi:UTP--glucose-1-phosphate uridylyltransferase
VSVAVVPAAGFGTRLRPLSDAIPKEMLPVGGRLAMERIVEELAAAGVTRVVFVLSAAKEAFVQGRFGAGRDGVSFDYVLQPEMRGLGDAVLRAQHAVPAGEPFVVALGDAVFEEPAPGALTGRLVRRFAETGASVALAVQKVPRERISRYGVVKPAAAPAGTLPALGTDYLLISDIVEKPAPDEAPSDLAAAARYVLTGDVFDVLRDTAPGKNGEVQLTDALRNLLRRDDGRPGVAVPLAPDESRHDIGGLDSYYKAFVSFALADPEHGQGLREHLSRLIAAGGAAERAEPAEAVVE